MQNYKITLELELEDSALKYDDWIFRAISECLENQESIITYKLEEVTNDRE